jgi:hypothetical protein
MKAKIKYQLTVLSMCSLIATGVLMGAFLMMLNYCEKSIAGLLMPCLNILAGIGLATLVIKSVKKSQSDSGEVRETP